MATMTLEEKKKVYFKVAGYLAGLTMIELAFVYSPLPGTLKTILICVASLLKAVCVGWWYMHLNHETNSLKGLAILPFFIAFFYATYLIVDARIGPTRGIPIYFNAPAKVYKGESHHQEAAPAEGAPAEHKDDGDAATEDDEWS